MMLVARRLIDYFHCFLFLAAMLRTADFAVSDFYVVYPAENTSLHQYDSPCCSPAKLIMQLLDQQDRSVETG